jgi:hypothetical protein
MNPSTLRSRRRRAKMKPNERTREKARHAINRRVALILVLAPDLRCAKCDEQKEDPRELTVDHVDGRDWNIESLGQSRRAARYWREYKAGVRLRALCGLCNSTDGGYRRHGLQAPVDDDEVPF